MIRLDRLDPSPAELFVARAQRLAGERMDQVAGLPEERELRPLDQALLEASRAVPTLHVHGLFDQEDIYGPILAYAALEQMDTSNNRNFLVLGPWHHGQQTREASSLGPLQWGTDTGLYFREEVLQPFWDDHLKGIAPRGVRSQVTFLGAIPRDAVREAMWAADCFVLPSHAENFGVVLIEALATGLPVISTRCGGPEDIVNDDVGILLRPGDERGLADALAAMRGRPAVDPQAVRAYGVGRFGYAVVGPRLRDLYRAVLTS